MHKFLAVFSLILFTCPVAFGGAFDSVKIGGDFRYRNESLETEHNPTRYRQNFRVRLNATASLNEYMKFKTQLCTGTDEPLSTNETFDNGFSKKSIWLDLAYLEAKFKYGDGLTLRAGKMTSPFFEVFKSELVWDVKIRPEGIAILQKTHLGEVSVDANVGWFVLDERTRDEDSYLLAGQLIGNYKFKNKKTEIGAGATGYLYDKTKGYPPFWDGETSYGNTLDVNGNYASDFHLVEGFAWCIFDAVGQPLILFGHAVNNTAADSNDFGWTAGFQLGDAKKPGDWSLFYKYRVLENDATLNLYTDVSYRGNANDEPCHEIIASFKPLDHFIIMATAHLWKTVSGGQLLDNKRFRFDLMADF